MVNKPGEFQAIRSQNLGGVWILSSQKVLVTVWQLELQTDFNNHLHVNKSKCQHGLQCFVAQLKAIRELGHFKVGC